MANYGHIIFYSLVGGLFSLVGGIILLSKKKWADKLALYATPFAAGALLAAVFLDLLAEGVERANPYNVMLSTLIGMIVFFLAERFLHWFHHHHKDDATDKVDHTDDTVPLIIIGDTVHNALDGIAIAASFLISVPTGIITTIAVAAHEIPQEIGDFGLLLSKGLSRKKVLFYNVISALATLAFAVFTFWIGSDTQLPIGILFGLSAGFLLYIAASDIIPTLHDETPKQKLFDVRPLLLVVGAVTVGLAIHFAHSFVGHDTHSHESNHSHESAPIEDDHEENHEEDAETLDAHEDEPTEIHHEAIDEHADDGHHH